HRGELTHISLNHKIPAITDHDTGKSLMESGAILMYLAAKTGRFMSPWGSDRFWQEMEWMMFQMGHIGPMLGQTHHFLKFNPGKAPYAEQRYSTENERLYGVLEARLEGREYLVDDYSIADIATWPWISRYEWQQIDLDQFPRLKNWYVRIANRPAVQRGYGVPDPLPMPLPA
ncbi:MAG: glutathione binding-like protein, partial [Gammaproteobacteria bacterium]